MRVLHLFSGSGSMDQGFKERGHEVFRVDIERRFNPNLAADLIDLDLSDFPFQPDVILAGHPCECFSVSSISTHWWPTPMPMPRTSAAQDAVDLLNHTLLLIDRLGPYFWVLENPVGKMRRVIPDIPRSTVWYCQYGDERAKPTDLFGKLPPSFVAKTCKPGTADHASAPRGSRNGTQGRVGAFERSKVPYQLSLELCLAAEHDLPKAQRWMSEESIATIQAALAG